jgi:hypothetical protein
LSLLTLLGLLLLSAALLGALAGVLEAVSHDAAVRRRIKRPH